MSYHEPPTVLRIKRKRDQDPLQALILEDKRAVKRSKPSSPISSYVISPENASKEKKQFYFTLARTDDTTANNDESVISSILSEASYVKPSERKEGATDREDSTRKRNFIIPKRQIEEDTYIPNELTDMVNSFLKVEHEDTIQRKKRARGHKEDAASELAGNSSIDERKHVEPDISDYVYDVYHLSPNEPLTSDNYPQSQIGYIRFFEDENEELIQSENDVGVYSDDEDSNAEDYYQNDYPSDEDAGIYSDSYTNVEENQDDDDELPLHVDDEESFSYLNTQGASEIQDENFEDLYDDFYGNEDEDNINFLPDDKYNKNGDEGFERNHFFEGDEDDELAIHRDKIFGNLQKMINERD